MSQEISIIGTDGFNLYLREIEDFYKDRLSNKDDQRVYEKMEWRTSIKNWWGGNERIILSHQERNRISNEIPDRGVEILLTLSSLFFFRFQNMKTAYY